MKTLREKIKNTVQEMKRLHCVLTLLARCLGCFWGCFGAFLGRFLDFKRLVIFLNN